MSLILAILLFWAGALAFFLILVGGVRRGDALRARALAGRLERELAQDLDVELPGGGRLAAPPRAARPPGQQGRRAVSG